MSKWPTQYRIKSRLWTIEYVPKTDEALHDSSPEDYCLGICQADQRRIWICTDQTESSMQDTLYHELVHACYSTSSRPATDDEEETEENVVLFATEAFFEIVRNAESDWWQ